MNPAKTKPGSFDCILTEKRRLGPDVYLLTLAVEETLIGAEPFSFLMFAVPGRPELLLRRPLCIFDASGDKTDGIDVLVRVAGEGTTALSSMPAGTRFDITGPFGNVYDVPGERVCIVAGGIGIAGLYLFVKRNTRAVSSLCFGSTTAWEPEFYEKLKNVGVTVEITTDDGALGRRGAVTDLITAADCDTVLACGPPAMLERVHEIASETGIAAYGSFEARMACGVGACRGCAIPVLPERTGGKEYLMICEDGPVFDTGIIDWEWYRKIGV